MVEWAMIGDMTLIWRHCNAIKEHWTIQDIHPKLVLNSKLGKSQSTLISWLTVKPFSNFVQSTTQCSVQNFETIGQLQNKLRADEIFDIWFEDVFGPDILHNTSTCVRTSAFPISTHLKWIKSICALFTSHHIPFQTTLHAVLDLTSWKIRRIYLKPLIIFHCIDSCVVEITFDLHMRWNSSKPKSTIRRLIGYPCFVSHSPSLTYRVYSSWQKRPLHRCACRQVHPLHVLQYFNLQAVTW